MNRMNSDKQKGHFYSIKEEPCSKRGPIATDQRRARREVARRRAPRRSRSVLYASSGSCSGSSTSRCRSTTFLSSSTTTSLTLDNDEDSGDSKKTYINTRKGVQFHMNGKANPLTQRSHSFCYASQGSRHRSLPPSNLSSSLSWASSTDAVLSGPLSLGSTLDEKVEDDSSDSNIKSKDAPRFAQDRVGGNANAKAQRSHSFCFAPRGLHNNEDGGDRETTNKGVKFLSNGAISFTGPIALYCVPPIPKRETTPKRRRSARSFSSSSGSKLDDDEDGSDGRKTNNDTPKCVQFHFNAKPNPRARRSRSFCNASQGSRDHSWPHVHDEDGRKENNDSTKCVQFHYPTALFSLPIPESLQDTSSTFSTDCNPRSDSGTRMRRTSSGGGGGGSASKPSSSGLDCNPFSGALWDKREGL